MVNEVILAKLQGFLLGMPIVFSNTPTAIPLKACADLSLASREARSGMSNCTFELGINTYYRGLRSFVCVCVYKSNVALLHCVISDVLSHLGYSSKTEIFKVCKCATCRHFEPLNFNLGLDE